MNPDTSWGWPPAHIGEPSFAVDGIPHSCDAAIHIGPESCRHESRSPGGRTTRTEQARTL